MLPESEVRFQAERFLDSRGYDFDVWARSKDLSLRDRQAIFREVKKLERQRRKNSVLKAAMNFG